MEAIHLQAIARAAQIDHDMKLPEKSPENQGIVGRISSWWSPTKQPPLQARPHAPQVTSHIAPKSQIPGAKEGLVDQNVPEEEFSVKGLHSMQSVALRLNKKLELTSVKKLMRLNKYKAFSSEELAHVSNGHILSVMEQVQRIRGQIGEWTLGQKVFQIVESSAELCLKVNDYAEAINQDIYRKMHKARSPASP